MQRLPRSVSRLGCRTAGTHLMKKRTTRGSKCSISGSHSEPSRRRRSIILKEKEIIKNEECHAVWSWTDS